MANPIPISTVIKMIKYGMETVEIVTSNKEACARVADDLEIIYDILKGVDETNKSSADKHRYFLVMKKLYGIAVRSKILFERCVKGKRMVRIRNFLSARPIKTELEKIQSEIPLAINMLCLVFHVKQNFGRARCSLPIPEADESVFDNEDAQTAEGDDAEYYLDDDTEDE
ncbi:unnamed protein product [Adineta ricciae]|uniref:Uncharacterized protein n=1 Tax=Adineta ricciae TaxID=249248 RepID=A0A814YBL9_ADIRI|nr:unnamed protein product [Adineta ricciae]CAF1324439.1 unnamed protein product [Adineta ricciae]